MPSRTTPLLAAALVCEKVLRERDDVLSAIRIVDTIFLPSPSGRVALTVLIAVKAGEFVGKGTLRVDLRAPSGARTPMPEGWPVVLRGGHEGAQMTIEIALEFREFGVYWLDVFWDNDLLSSIPIKLAPRDQLQSTRPREQTSDEAD